MTLLAVPICGAALDEAAAAMRAAQQGGAELIELRLDLLPADAERSLPDQAALPVLATCRSGDEGGKGGRDDVARARRLVAAAAHGASYIDFEWAAWNRSSEARRIISDAIGTHAGPGGKPIGLVLSAHDFTGRPAGLMTLAKAMWASPARVAKIAYTAKTAADAFDALDLLHAAGRDRPTIALAMGEHGVMTRLLARKLGAFCTFAAADAGSGTAPCQPTLEQMRTLYRWSRVGPDTELFGVIGFPIAHSMSPAIHNGAFDAVDYDGLYVPLLVEPTAEGFAALVNGLAARQNWLNVRGLSVTIPHKENTLAWLRARGVQVEPLGQRIGAINTIRFEHDGGLIGRNTDYAAALDAVCAALRCRRADLAGRSVAVLGAGGAARAIVAGFVDAGCGVRIYNRTQERSEALAAEFGCQARPFTDRGDIDAQIVINATSIGMSPNVDESPLPDGAIRAGQLMFDTVYNPVQTRLLTQARAAAAMAVDGVEMFVRQAAEQFEHWVGLDAPLETMRRAVLDRLGQ